MLAVSGIVYGLLLRDGNHASATTSPFYAKILHDNIDIVLHVGGLSVPCHYHLAEPICLSSPHYYMLALHHLHYCADALHQNISYYYRYR